MLRRLGKLILLVAALTCLAGITAIAAGLVMISHPEFQRWLGERLTEKMGPGFVFSDVSLAFWPAPGVRLHGISLAEEAVEADPRGLNVQSVGCTFRIASLLEGEVVVDRIFVEKPSLSVERGPAGEWVFEPTLQRWLARATSGERAGPPSNAAPFTLPHFSLRDGTLLLDDRGVAGGPVQLRIEHLDLDIDPPRPKQSGRVRISADGAAHAHLEVDATIEPLSPGASLADLRFDAALRGRSLGSDDALLYLLFGLPIRNRGGTFDIAGSVSRRAVGRIEGSAGVNLPSGSVDGWGIRLATPMRLAASFDVEDGKFSMHQARLRAPRISFSRYAGENPTAVFNWSAGNLLVEGFDFDAYGGAWKTKGSVSFGDEPGFRLEVRADEVALGDLSLAVTGDELESGFESLFVEGAFGGVWAGSDAWLATLSGSGHATLTGGQMESSPVMRSVLAALFGKIPGFSHLEVGGPGGRPTDLDRLTASFAVRDSRIFSDDIDLRTSDYRMRGRGSVGFDGTLDVATDVALTAHGVEELYLLAARPFRESGDRSLPSIPVQLSGTLVDPVVIPDVSSLSLAPFRMLFGGAKGTVGLLGDTLDAGGGSLKKGVDKVFGLEEKKGEGTSAEGAASRKSPRSREAVRDPGAP